MKQMLYVYAALEFAARLYASYLGLVSLFLISVLEKSGLALQDLKCKIKNVSQSLPHK